MSSSIPEHKQLLLLPPLQLAQPATAEFPVRMTAHQAQQDLVATTMLLFFSSLSQ